MASAFLMLLLCCGVTIIQVPNVAQASVPTQFATRARADSYFTLDAVRTDASSNSKRRRRSIEKRMTNGECVFNVANNNPCTSSFREATGRCAANTNVGKRTWGMVGTPYTRILAPSYENAQGDRRVTTFSNNGQFNSARVVSTTATITSVLLNRGGVSGQIMQWGQFIAHEITQLADLHLENGQSCCSSNKPDGADGICMEIRAGSSCVHHTRSSPAHAHDCTTTGPRQQMNAVTHVFDASNVYGSSEVEQLALRTSTDGLMKTQTVNGVNLPPPNLDGCPAAKASIGRCPFLGGDNRINTTPNLISTHAAFVNKHNQIAVKLKAVNSGWDDERLFQETRRIIAAIQANIHYYEYLPIIIGPAAITKYGLESYKGHNANVNPSILNELAGAAFRFGHSTINGFTQIGSSGAIPLKFTDAETVIYDGGISQCTLGLERDNPWFVDRQFPSEMRNTLFDRGEDIVAFNINRGRDHGFKSYFEYRRHYSLFTDVARSHDPVARTSLLNAYNQRANDIELYIGGVTEDPVPGGLVGPLFAEIIGDGFQRTRDGDRSFFESSNSGLTAAQIATIKRVTYAQVLCEGNSIPRFGSKAFFHNGSEGSAVRDCTGFPQLDLSLWRETTPVPPPTTCSWINGGTHVCTGGCRVRNRVCQNLSSSCTCAGHETVTESC